MSQVSYTLVSPSGEVLRTGNCQSDDIGLQANEGQQVVAGLPPNPPSCFVYVNSAWLERPERPSDWHTWSADTLTWVNVQELSIQQQLKWSQVKAARSAAIDANLETPYGTFQCSPEDRQNITDSIMLAQTLASMGQAVTIPWTLADNTVVTLDLSQLVTVGLLLGQKVQAAHATARTLRAAIEAATTVEEVAAVVWSQ